MESMTNAPYYLTTARSGFRMGNATAIDGMIHDGLWDPYNNFHMGNAGELCAKEYKFTRELQDEFAVNSYKKALKAIESGAFKEEITPVEIASKKETIKIETDEEPGRGKLDQFSKLRAAFDKEGTITAANASSINDGASMLVIGGESSSHKPIARLVHWAEFAQAPEWFTTAPVGSIKKLLDEAIEYMGAGGVASYQTEYNLFERMIEMDGTLDLCRQQKIQIIAYSPINPQKFALVHNGKLAILDKIAAKYGKTRAQLILSWIIQHAKLLPLVRTTKMDHLIVQ
jgi:hypothetical protein